MTDTDPKRAALDALARGEDPQEAYLAAWIEGTGYSPMLKAELRKGLGIRPKHRATQTGEGNE